MNGGRIKQDGKEKRQNTRVYGRADSVKSEKPRGEKADITNGRRSKEKEEGAEHGITELYAPTAQYENKQR